MAENREPVERIAVFRALQLGDLLCTVPAFRALREANPDAKITLIGLPWANEFAARYRHYIDEFVEFPGHPAFPERVPDLAAFGPFLARVQVSRLDLAIQLHGSGEVANPLVALFGATRMAGFAHPGAYCGDAPGFIAWPDDLPEIERYLALMSHLGFEPAGREIDLPLSPEERERGAELLRELGVRRERLVCIHPGARLPSRRWPVERFAEVARMIEEAGYDVVLTGSAAESSLVEAVASGLRCPRSLCGRTDFGALAAIIGEAQLLTSNDTGVSHVAAALRTPSVIIASGSDVERWHPLDRERHIVLASDVECRPCAHHECPIGHPCALGVSVEKVVDVALAKLRTSSHR